MVSVDVIIATPGSGMRAEYVQSLVRTTSLLNSLGISYVFTNAQSSLVHHARELTASGVTHELDPSHAGPLGNATYKKIFWIDSDITWEPADFLKLYQSAENIIAGVYLMTDGVKTSCCSQQYPMGVPKESLQNATRPCKVLATGFGFVCIKRGVFESIGRPWFVCLPHEVSPNVIDSMGEDISFCVKASKQGFDAFVDPTVKVGHIKAHNVCFS